MKCRHLAVGLSLLLLISTLALAAPLRVTVNSGEHARKNVVVRKIVLVDQDQADKTDVQVSSGDQTLAAQLTAPSLLAKPAKANDKVARELHFIVPKLE